MLFGNNKRRGGKSVAPLVPATDKFMITSFIEVKREMFSISTEVVTVARKLILLENAAVVNNDIKSFNEFENGYRSFNEILKDLTSCKNNDLIVWRLKGDAVEICVLDYYDDGSIFKVVHWPSNEELAANNEESLIGVSLEVTTFDEYAEEVDVAEIEQVTQALTIAEGKHWEDGVAVDRKIVINE